MSSNRKPVRAVFHRKTVHKEEAVQTELSSVLSYALLILYVLASVSSTKDSMLLMPSKGIQLPLVSATVSVVGFYFLSPMIVLAGHLVTLRRLPKMFAGLKSSRSKKASEILSHRTDLAILMCLVSAGPATLFYILTKFTAYQSPFLFVIQLASFYCACYASLIRIRELLAKNFSNLTQTSMRWLRRLGSCFFGLWLLVCIDVIFLPAQISPVLWFKTHTALLDNEDGGTLAWVPHIEIDRGEHLWSGPSKIDAELAAFSGHADPKEYFMNREVAIDLRSRNLRYLDISLQVIPRIWAHNADLAGANFSYARLYGSIFVDATLDGVDFSMASLDGATFMNIDLVSTNFIQTRMKGTFWDNVTVKNASFINADLSLASFFNVSFDQVEFLETSLQAASLSEVKGDTLGIAAQDPYMIMYLGEGENWLKDGDYPVKVNPKAALESLKEYLCKPTLTPDWAYAWGLFVQTKLLVARSEPEVTKAMHEFMKAKDCEGLPDRGFRVDALGILAAAARDKAAQEYTESELQKRSKLIKSIAPSTPASPEGGTKSVGLVVPGRTTESAQAPPP